MAMAVITARHPQQVHLEAGKEYYWCARGLSMKQPFCDGSHDGTGIHPVAFTATETKDAWLCLCKQTHDAPYCDGTHKTLPEGVTALPSVHVDAGGS